MNPSAPSPARRRILNGGAVVLALTLLASGVALPAMMADARTPDSARPLATAALGSTINGSFHLALAESSPAQLDAIGSLVTQRLALALPVAQSKWLSGKPVADPVREKAVVDEAVALAQQHGVDPELVTRVITAQISASKIIQRGLITHWTHNPATAPTTAPDLSTIRPQLDNIDADLVTAIGQAERLAHDPHCTHLVDAERAQLYVGLDSLHQKGIRAAFHDFCSA
jgi:chorismate mutase